MERKSRIICTIGKIKDEELENRIKEFIDAGMDVARINMAHYDVNKDEDKDYLKRLIKVIRDKASEAGKFVAIMGDIQGPKVRIAEFLGLCKGESSVVVQPDDKFILTYEFSLPENQKGARVKHEGDFALFPLIKGGFEKDQNGKYKYEKVEFWIGEAKVVLTASIDKIYEKSAECEVIVSGEIELNKGISIKNSTVNPGVYNLARYHKDAKDIEFLLQLGVDLFALSFVNSAQDVINMQHFIDLKIEDRGLVRVQKRYLGMMAFPIISKIETQAGINNIDDISKASYGIMVARGDLALRTGIEVIGINQKFIIEKCVALGKPVITATQMLLSMMEFKEPRRSEATDVTNAIFDGTDSLMLSEETGDPKSKYPVDSIRVMGKIASVTEEEIKRRNRTEYKYKIDHQHEESRNALKEERERLDNNCGNNYQNDINELLKREEREHISYTACKMAHEMHCKAIIVITTTGGTARAISRFKPDVPVLAGVYDAQIARILKLCYGVEPIIINRDNERYPFNLLEQVVKIATQKGLIQQGDRVILVAGYPLEKPGTVTFLNIHRVGSPLMTEYSAGTDFKDFS